MVCGVCVCVCVGVWVGGSGWRRTAASGEADGGAHAHAAATQPTESETRACARRAMQTSHLKLIAISSLLLGRPVGQHTITNDQACDQEGGIHLASASRLMGNAAVKCSDAAVRQRTEDTERGARLEAHLARLTTRNFFLAVHAHEGLRTFIYGGVTYKCISSYIKRVASATNV